MDGLRSSLAALMLVALGASTALAAPPPNDDIENATEIFGLPFLDQVDTTEATTAADDPDCFGQGPTVWYSFAPDEDVRVEANTFGSDYDTTLSVYTGQPGALVQLACVDDSAATLQSRVRFDALAGETYFFMVGAFASGSGGNLVLSVDEAPPAGPPLEIDLSIDGIARVNPRTGIAEVSGVLTCSEPAVAVVDGTLRQKLGRRFVIQGFFFAEFECVGETRWTATVVPFEGNFGGGAAFASVSAFAFSPDTDETDSDTATATVRLRPQPSTPNPRGRGQS